MTEAVLQSAVIDLAHLLGYKVAHFRPAMLQSGRWATPVQADGAGWPDLAITGRDRFLVAELKSATGRLSADQEWWLAALGAAGVETHVWRPGDWSTGLVETVLRRGTQVAA